MYTRLLAVVILLVVVVLFASYYWDSSTTTTAPNVDEMFKALKNDPDEAQEKYNLDDGFLVDINQIKNKNGKFTKKDVKKLLKKYDDLKKDEDDE